jgi:hypothetical protein
MLAEVYLISEGVWESVCLSSLLSAVSILGLGCPK